MQILYPQRLVYGDPPATVSLTRWGTSELSQTLTVTVSAQPGILLRDASGQITLTRTDLVFTPSVTQTQTISFSVQNSQTFNGCNITSEALVRLVSRKACNFKLQTLTIAPESLALQDLPIDIEVEGAQRGKFRSFVNSTVNEKNPLLILIPGIITLVVGVFNLIRQQKREEKAETERLQKLAAEALAEAKSCLRTINASAARGALSALREEKLTELAQASGLERVEALTQLAEGKNCDIEAVVTSSTDVLPNESAGALIARSRNYQALDRRALLITIRGFPRDQISPDLQSALTYVLNSLEEIATRPRHWPERPSYPPPDPTLFKGEMNILLGGANPLGSEWAEDERPTLFGQIGAFWGEHSDYQALKNRLVPEIISGPEGCGKTAMALALVEINEREDTLPVYLSVQPLIRESEIQRAVTHRMLDFVSVRPYLLANLGQRQLKLLAQLFVAGVGKDSAVAHLEAARKDEDRLKQALSESQRDLWEREDEAQFKVLEKNLQEVDVISWGDEGAWLRLVEQCARSLGFARVMLVLDATGDCEAWVRGLLPRLRYWAAHAVMVKLFVPEPIGQRLASVAEVSSTLVSWSESDLRMMAPWRFDQFMRSVDRRILVTHPFEPGVYDQFIQGAQSNPRRLIKLWNALLAVHDLDSATFSKDELNRALNSLQ